MNAIRIPSFRAALAAIALSAAACSLDPWSGREGVIAEGIRVDSLRFTPAGSRYVLRDSAARIRLVEYRTGYAVGPACARILALGVDSVPAGIPPAYPPVSRVQMPGNPETCPVDSGGRDTTVTRVFRDGTVIRLANSRNAITDSALLVAGTMSFDSVKGIAGVAGTFSAGGLTFRDSSVVAPRFLFTDSVDACRRLNQAEYRKGDAEGKGDTIRVWFSWVKLDSSAVAGGCAGLATDSVPVSRRAP